MKYTTLVLLVANIMVIAVNIGSTDAKRGCASFGHACYGGMGKRNDDLTNSNEEILQDAVSQDDNPQFVFTGPRSDNNNGDMNNHIRRPSLSASNEELREQLYHLSPFLRQWLRSYRNAELNNRK